MIVTRISESEVAWMEPETDEERAFLDACPKEWTWDQVAVRWSVANTDDHPCVH